MLCLLCPNRTRKSLNMAILCGKFIFEVVICFSHFLPFWPPPTPRIRSSYPMEQFQEPFMDTLLLARYIPKWHRRNARLTNRPNDSQLGYGKSENWYLFFNYFEYCSKFSFLQLNPWYLNWYIFLIIYTSCQPCSWTFAGD